MHKLILNYKVSEHAHGNWMRYEIAVADPDETERALACLPEPTRQEFLSSVAGRPDGGDVPVDDQFSHALTFQLVSKLEKAGWEKTA